MYSVAMSLDGYIARPDGSYDWIPDEPTIDWAEFMGRFDTMLVGRKTWEVAPAPESQPMRTYLFSSTLRQDDYPSVTVVNQDAADFVARLRQETGKDIWLMGGGQLFRSLFQAGLVDAVETAVTPVLLGRGLPMLPNAEQSARLTLRQTRTFPSGIVLLTYDVLRDTA
jgi:dihydrofolate reductase